MHAISSYRGNRYHPPARPPARHRQDRLQCTAPLCLARSVTTKCCTVNWWWNVDQTSWGTFLYGRPRMLTFDLFPVTLYIISFVSPGSFVEPKRRCIIPTVSRSDALNSEWKLCMDGRQPRPTHESGTTARCSAFIYLFIMKIVHKVQTKNKNKREKN